jgi:hypothetical protein
VNTAVGILLAFVFMVVVVWVVVFGASSALLARRRGTPVFTAFALGTLVGPFAWAWVLWSSRSRAGRVESLDFDDDGDIDAPLPAARPYLDPTEFTV